MSASSASQGGPDGQRGHGGPWWSAAAIGLASVVAGVVFCLVSTLPFEDSPVGILAAAFTLNAAPILLPVVGVTATRWRRSPRPVHERVLAVLLVLGGATLAVYLAATLRFFLLGGARALPSIRTGLGSEETLMTFGSVPGLVLVGWGFEGRRLGGRSRSALFFGGLAITCCSLAWQQWQPLQTPEALVGTLVLEIAGLLGLGYGRRKWTGVAEPGAP